MLLFCFCLSATFPTLSLGQQGFLPNLAKRISDARERLRADAIPSPQSHVAALRQALLDFDAFLAANSTPAVRETWHRYLDLERALKILETGKPIQQGILAQSIAFRLSRNQPGMERPAMVRVREVARQATEALRFQQPEFAIKGLDAQLLKVAETLRETESLVPSAETLAATSVIYQNLQTARQVPDLTAELKQHFNRSNARVLIGGEAITSSLTRSVNDTNPVNQCILGTRVIGTAHASGQVFGQLLPSDGAIRLALVLRSQVASRAIGYNGPVRAHTTSSAHVTSSKILTITEAGITAEPATISSDFQSKIQCFDHPLKIVRRIASKRAAQQKSQSDAIAQSRLEAQARQSFDQQVNAQLAARPPQPPLLGNSLVVLKRLGLDEPRRHLSCDGQFVHLDLLIESQGQLTAPNSPHAPLSNFRGALQLHESSVNNIAMTLLAGRTLTGNEIAQLVESLNLPGREAPAKTTNKETETGAAEDFEIDMAAFRPIIFEAREGKLVLGIQGNRFASGGRELKRPLEIVATYRPVAIAGRQVLEREADAEINFPGRTKLSLTEVTIRRNIQRLLADKFPKRLLERDLPLPAMAKNASPLGVTWIDADNGWLSIGAE